MDINWKKQNNKLWTGQKVLGNHGLRPVEVRRENAGYYIFDATNGAFVGACFDTIKEVKEWLRS